MRKKLSIYVISICILIAELTSCTGGFQTQPSGANAIDLTYPSNLVFLCKTKTKTYAPLSERIKSMLYSVDIISCNDKHSIDNIDSEAVISCYIPHNVSGLSASYFHRFENLQSISADGNNPNYTSVCGVLYDKEMNEIIAYPQNRFGIYNIPESVEYIADYAFYGNKLLEQITISASIKHIGDYAFSASNLKYVEIISDDTTIGSDAFHWCLSLQNASLPSDFNFYSAFTFTPIFQDITPDFATDGTILTRYQGAGGDIIIPDGITEIAKGAFDNVLYLKHGGEEITRVYIPDSVTKIESFAFFACTELTWVSVSPNTEIEDDAFLECHPEFKIIVRE